MKCYWENDVHGFYITPLFGISKVKEVWSIWLGWFYWLFTWQLNQAKDQKRKEN
jgi:hypothetical protein